MEQDSSIFHVTGHEIEAIPIEAIILVRLPFLTETSQSPENADPGRIYALRIEVARNLRDALSHAIDDIEDIDPDSYLIY